MCRTIKLLDRMATFNSSTDYVRPLITLEEIVFGVKIVKYCLLNASVYVKYSIRVKNSEMCQVQSW